MASDTGILGRARATATAGATGVRSMWTGLGRTEYGRAFQRGAGQAFGMHYGKTGASEGFLGLREMAQTGKFSGKRFRAGTARIGRSLKSIGTGQFKAGAGGMAKGLGHLSVGKLAGRAIMPAFTAYEMYHGYKEGGVLGAAGAGVSSAVTWGAWELGAAVLGSTAMWAGMGAAAAGYGYYQLGEAAQRHGKRLRHLEMGATVADPFGTTATLRQRSLAALHNTHINGRMAVGNEAAIFHDGAYRR